MTLSEALTGGVFDRPNWQHNGEFDQNFSKKSNAPGFARGGGMGDFGIDRYIINRIQIAGNMERRKFSLGHRRKMDLGHGFSVCQSFLVKISDSSSVPNSTAFFKVFQVSIIRPLPRLAAPPSICLCCNVTAGSGESKPRDLSLTLHSTRGSLYVQSGLFCECPKTFVFFLHKVSLI